MHPSVAKLVELLPPHAGAGDDVDWDQAAARWGTRFPSDYRSFVEVYGGGAIDDSLFIGVPLELARGRQGPATFEELTEYGYDLLDLAPGEEPDLPGRISWAMDCSANHAFWDTSDPDPDRWTVVVLERHAQWTSYNCGMVDFLVRYLAAPVRRATGTFSPDRPKFVNWREEIRRRKSVVDLWSATADVWPTFDGSLGSAVAGSGAFWAP